MNNPLDVSPEVFATGDWMPRVMHGNPDLADIWIGYIGMGMVHNQPCAVCGAKHAILDGSTGIMQPCSSCAAEGYRVVKKRRRVKR